jgi:drug/metabolite transporter (DMT)-like permease
MSWIVLAGLSALFESFKDVASKRSLPLIDVYMISWVLFAPMLPICLGCLIFGAVPPLNSAFYMALFWGGTLNAIAVVLYVQALKSSDLSLTVPVVTLTPLFMLATSPVLVQESPTGADAVGVLLIVAGAYVLNLRASHQGYWAPFQALLSQPGPRLMLIVALIWSFTSNFDKIGVVNSTPGFWVVSLFSFVAVALTPVVLLKSKRPFQQIRSAYPLLLLIGSFSTLAIIFQMQAVKITHVTQVIAVKRISALFGVVWGHLLFKEKGLRERALGTVLMMIGVLCITVF